MDTEKLEKGEKATLKELIECFRGLTDHWDDVKESSEWMQRLATEARLTGKSQSHRLTEKPTVRDASPYWLRLKKLWESKSIQELEKLLK